MTTELSQSKCEACNIDAPTLSNDEISELQVQIPSWEVISDEGINRLICSFAFTNYEDSLAFTNKVAQLAEAEDHHHDQEHRTKKTSGYGIKNFIDDFFATQTSKHKRKN